MDFPRVASTCRLRDKKDILKQIHTTDVKIHEKVSIKRAIPVTNKIERKPNSKFNNNINDKNCSIKRISSRFFSH